MALQLKIFASSLRHGEILQHRTVLATPTSRCAVLVATAGRMSILVLALIKAVFNHKKKTVLDNRWFQRETSTALTLNYLKFRSIPSKL